MRLILCGFVVLAAALAPTNPASAQRRSRADSISALFLDTVAGTSVSDWKAHTPGATWQRYRGTAEQILDSDSWHRGVEPTGFWCAVATDYRDDVERVAVFFALRDAEPAACRIELVQGVVRRATDRAAASLFGDLSDAITQRLGIPARSVDPVADTPYPYGSGYPPGVAHWQQGLAWHEDQRDVFLFRAARVVGFASRSSRLTPEAESEYGAAPTDVAGEAERRLADVLRERLPNAAAAIRYPFLYPEHQAEIRRALIDVLDARAGATPESQPLLTFAADRLARKLWVEPPVPSAHRELAPLLRRGVGFVRDPYSELWIYDGTLVRIVLRRWQETPWGQIAFVTHLYGGWTNDTCDGTAYANVIRRGDAWLQSHPDSPWRRAVMTAVARAYETKWALIGSFTADPRENARRATPDQESARLRAIELYETVIRLAPNSPDAAYARRRVVQIRANMTTSQDAYRCVYA